VIIRNDTKVTVIDFNCKIKMKTKLNNNGMVGGGISLNGGGSQGGSSGLSKELPNIQTRSLGSGLPPSNGA
jgi:hypothetical protein